MANRRQYWLTHALMSNICSAHNILDSVSYELQEIDSSNGNPRIDTFANLKQNGVVGCQNVINIETRIKSFIVKYGIANVAPALTATNYNATETRDELIAIADEARYVLENLILAETKADLIVLGEHIQSEIPPLITPLNEWRL